MEKTYKCKVIKTGAAFYGQDMGVHIQLKEVNDAFNSTFWAERKLETAMLSIALDSMKSNFYVEAILDENPKMDSKIHQLWLVR